jgi:23S rRNA (pseudouridine1915-N3)-methyltransferase
MELIEVREDEQVGRRLPERAYVCLLDQGGEELDSVAFSRFLEQRRQSGQDLCFVVGGPFGLDLPEVHRLSLGQMTLPHQLARVVLLEQLYRAHKILAGEPYHY